MEKGDDTTPRHTAIGARRADTLSEKLEVHQIGTATHGRQLRRRGPAQPDARHSFALRLLRLLLINNS